MRRRPQTHRAEHAEITRLWRQLQRYRRGTPTIAEIDTETALNDALDRLPR